MCYGILPQRFSWTRCSNMLMEILPQLLLDTLLEVGEQKDLLKKVVRKIGLAFTWMKE